MGYTFRTVAVNILLKGEHQIINYEQGGVKVLFASYKIIIYFLPPTLQTIAM